MTRSLRSAHRRIVALLAISLPPLLSVALAVRRDLPVNEKLPGDSVSRVESTSAGEPAFESLAPGIWARTLRGETGEPRAVEIRFDADPRVPDLLLYWGSESRAKNELPEDALLLGSASGAGTETFEIFESTRRRNGSVLLYSLARHEVVAGTVGAPAGGTGH